jgi:hypothetical protein
MEPVPVLEEPNRPRWPGTGGTAAAADHHMAAGLAMPAGAALGQATPNSTYVGQRLLYDKPPEASFDPIYNTAILWQMFRQWVLYWLVWFLGAFLGTIFFAFVGLAAGFRTAITLWVIVAALCSFIAACLFWLAPLPALLSEWKFAVDGKGAATAATFGHIIWALQRRRTPLKSLQVRRLRLAGEGGRDYLELRQGIFTGYVACFAYGEDLYVGWTLWVRVSPLRYVLMFIARIWQSLIQRGTDIYVTLRYDSARAMREAMHSAAREGIDVASGDLPAQGHGIIGTDVAVTDVTV